MKKIMSFFIGLFLLGCSTTPNQSIDKKLTRETASINNVEVAEKLKSIMNSSNLECFKSSEDETFICSEGENNPTVIFSADPKRECLGQCAYGKARSNISEFEYTQCRSRCFARYPN